MRNAAAMTACTSHYAVLHTQEVTGSSPAVSTILEKSELDSDREWVRISCFGPVKIYAQNCLQAPAEWVPSRFMRKIVCRLRLNEVSRQ